MEEINSNACSLKHYNLIRETKEYRHMPFGFREYLCRDKKLTQTSKLAWIVLYDYSVFSDEYKVHMSLRTLGEKIGKDKRTAKRALEELEKYGYIQTNLKNSERGNDRTIIWVRFPQEAVIQILEKPDRKATKFKIPKDNLNSNKLTQEFNLTNEGNSFTEERDIFAQKGASLPKSGAPMPPINTNNIIDLTITKKTTNNVDSNKDNVITAENNLLKKLQDVECLFLKFIERANVLQSQDLELSTLKAALWEPYNHWEKCAIERFAELKKLVFTNWNVGNAVVLKAQYDELFKQARISGLSPLQAAKEVQNEFDPEQMNAINSLHLALTKMADILNPPHVAATKFKDSNSNPEPEKVISLNLQPKLTLNQKQVNLLVRRLQQVHQDQALQGEAAKTELKMLVEQLIFHAEHWAPSTIEFKTQDERINIAISVAIKRMKAGNWSAPYGWAKQLSLKLEQNSNQEKIVEEIAISSGGGRIDNMKCFNIGNNRI